MQKMINTLFICLSLSAALFPTMSWSAEAPKSLVFRTQDPQEMTVVSDGALSLQMRLDMIEKATSTIEAEDFIYATDKAGRLFTQALIKKAKQGKKVRLIIDYGLPIAELNPFYAKELQDAGIEIRYYNPSFAFELFRGQFRSHRKGLVVDDTYSVTGGRNVADEYFDLNETYNFLDRDVFIKGSMAKAMRESFDKFWFSDMTTDPTKLRIPSLPDFGFISGNPANLQDPLIIGKFRDALFRYQVQTTRAKDYVLQNKSDRDLAAKLKEMQKISGQKISTRICKDSIFAADMPGLGEDARILSEEVRKQLADAKSSIKIESPYFVIQPAVEDMLTGILKNNVKISVYTNSLNSTDAGYTTAAFYPRVGTMIKNGMEVFIYRGLSLKTHDYVNNTVRNARWGIHAKTAVIDGKTIMIGTFNADPRSTNINAEMAVICRDNPLLAQDVMDSVRERQSGSVQLDQSGNPVDGTSKFADVSLFKKLIYILILPESNFLDFLL